MYVFNFKHNISKNNLLNLYTCKYRNKTHSFSFKKYMLMFFAKLSVRILFMTMFSNWQVYTKRSILHVATKPKHRKSVIKVL